MKALKKYAYQSPKTEILSLEIGSQILNDPSPSHEHPEEVQPGSGAFGSAPWRY